MPTKDPHEVARYQVVEGKTAIVGDKAIGDRGTLQLTRRDAAQLLKNGIVEEVEGHQVPDVADGSRKG